MSRINIEDCIKVVGNRFRLVMYAAQRGREIVSGMPTTIDEPIAKHDKSAVIALREIVQGKCDQPALERAIIRNHRRYSPIEAAQEGGETEDAQESGETEGAVAGVVAGVVEGAQEGGAVAGAVASDEIGADGGVGTSDQQPVQVTDSSLADSAVADSAVADSAVADSAVAEAAIDTSDTSDAGDSTEQSSKD